MRDAPMGGLPRNQLRTIIQQTQIPLATNDASGCITMLSPAFEELFEQGFEPLHERDFPQKFLRLDSCLVREVGGNLAQEFGDVAITPVESGVRIQIDQLSERLEQAHEVLRGLKHRLNRPLRLLRQYFLAVGE